MDLVMPKKDGAEATAAIKAERPGTRILVLTTFSDTDDIARALAAGADGAMLKNADYSEVVAAIRAVAAGQTAVAPEVRKMLDENPPLPELTDRQLDVLTSMVRGFTNFCSVFHLIDEDGEFIDADCKRSSILAEIETIIESINLERGIDYGREKTAEVAEQIIRYYRIRRTTLQYL